MTLMQTVGWNRLKALKFFLGRGGNSWEPNSQSMLSNPGGTADPSGFADVVVAKLELEAGAWVIIGRAVVHNGDGDHQHVTARIVHDANVIIDNVNVYADGHKEHCLAAQATLKSRRPETVVLACNTFNGNAKFDSLIAFKVDDVAYQ